MQQFTGPGRR